MEMELELELEMEMSEPEIEVASVEDKPEAPVEVEETNDEQPTEEQSEPDSEATEEPTVETEDSTEQEEVQQEEVEETEKPVKEPSAKEKAATKIVKKIGDKERYDDAAQMKTLIVMQILGNTKTFFDTQSTIVDTDVNEYLNKTIEDNYGVLFNMAQAQTIEEMINAQTLSIKDLNFSGGKFFIILSLIGAIIGGGWSGYRFYDDYLDMKQQVQDFVAPDLSEFDKKIDLAEAEMDKRLELIEQELEMIKGEMSMILEEVQLVAGVSSELKNDLKADLRAMNNDIRHITEIVNDVEDRQKEDTREVLDELKLIEEALDIKIDKALNNPLSGMSAKSK